MTGLLTRCSNDDYFWMAKFPHGNRAYSMTLLLPDEDLGLDKCLEALTGESWKEWNMGWTSRELIVKMPRFEIKYNKNLIEDMKVLGIKEAFTSSANFTNLSDKALYLGLLNQQTYLKVDEEGTEAAAVTLTGGVAEAGPPPEGPVEFYLNRPFAFMITETSTGTVLFMGKVTNLKVLP